MKNKVNPTPVAKKNYNQPQTEVMSLRMDNLMLSVSTAPTGGGGMAGAPGRKGDPIGY